VHIVDADAPSWDALLYDEGVINQVAMEHHVAVMYFEWLHFFVW
jgi:hypothetical protein